MIKNLFKKDIFRKIEGVVKADNLTDEAVFTEVDEYVITKDLEKKLDDFFSVYSFSIGKSTEDIGVWISGFFGSGKSHLLKILSYILSNRSIHSDIIGELFLEKIEDFELQNNIKKALTIPADTILFNIDQKAQDTTDSNAILSVFMQVFNEMRGYYPKHGYIAKFEADLDKDGLFEEFKEKFKELSGESWESGRETIFLELENIGKALSQVKGISEEVAMEVIGKYEENYVLSIEDFVQEVKEFVDKQPKNYRLIFCVDEIGQFIGDNTKLMLNLQTITETLATKLKGQAWIMVTSQSAVNDLVTNQKSQEFDFSKIMGRFAVKINLTSQNAHEVIQKRVLEKTEDKKEDLVVMYNKIQNSLQSIIHFTNTRQYNSYKNSNDFVDFYPFVPYQLDLFQSAIMGLSRNNLFQGKHQAIGERSMLFVVQEVAKNIANEEIGVLVTFDKFYDGISATIRGEYQTQLNQAIHILGENSLDIKVLKILFMLKYVKEFNTNLDNLTTLLVDNINVNIHQLKEDIKKSLDRLVENVFIQKVGESYEFLTDIEKDIENEIKEIQIEDREINKELASWIYDDILKTNKFRFDFNKQDYLFSRKMDNNLVKPKEEELSLNIITPFLSDEMDEDKIIHQSFATNDLIVDLGSDIEFRKEFELFVKTNKFIPQKQSSNLTDIERSLLITKQSDNTKRRDKLQNDLKDMFANAKLYHNGSPLKITSTDPKTLIDKAFNEVITTIYPSITMLNRVYTENDIKTILEQNDDLLTGSDDALNEAEKEIYNYLKRNSQTNITIDKIIENFTKKPYGWYKTGILALIASIYMKKRIDIKKHSNILNPKEVSNYILNNREHQNLTISIVKKIDDKKINQVKELLRELFPEATFTSTPREIIQTSNEHYRNLITQLKSYQNYSYPFVETIQETIQKLKIYEEISEDNFFDEILKLEDELLDIKEDYVDLILEFMKGEKFKIYKEIIEFLTQNKDNLFHITNEKINDLYALQKDKTPYQGNKIQKAKTSLKEIQNELTPIIETLKQKANQEIDTIIEKLQQDKLFQEVPVDERSKIIKPFLLLKDTINSSSNIDFINQRITQLNKMFDEAIEKMADYSPIDLPKTPKIRLQAIIPKDKFTLKSKEDIDEFITKLKRNLEEELNKGKEITL